MRKKRFTIFTAIIVYVLMMILSIPGLIPLLVLNDQLKSKELYLLLPNIGKLLGFVLLILLIRNKLPHKLSHLMKFSQLRSSIIVTVVLLAIGAYITFNNLVLIGLDMIGYSVSPRLQSGGDLPDSSLSVLVIFIIFLTIITPVIEEKIFRGIILVGLSHTYNRVIALLFSSFLFSLAHSNLKQQSIAFCDALVFGLVILLTANINYSIICHIVHNMLTSIFGVMAIRGYPGISIVNKNLVFHPYVTVGGVILFFITAFLFTYQVKKLDSRHRQDGGLTV